MRRRTDHEAEEHRGSLLVDVGDSGHRDDSLRGSALELRGRAGRGMIRAVEADAEAREAIESLGNGLGPYAVAVVERQDAAVVAR